MICACPIALIFYAYGKKLWGIFCVETIDFATCSQHKWQWEAMRWWLMHFNREVFRKENSKLPLVILKYFEVCPYNIVGACYIYELCRQKQSKFLSLAGWRLIPLEFYGLALFREKLYFWTLIFFQNYWLNPWLSEIHFLVHELLTNINYLVSEMLIDVCKKIRDHKVYFQCPKTKS